MKLSLFHNGGHKNIEAARQPGFFCDVICGIQCLKSGIMSSSFVFSQCHESGIESGIECSITGIGCLKWGIDIQLEQRLTDCSVDSWNKPSVFTFMSTIFIHTWYTDWSPVNVTNSIGPILDNRLKEKILKPWKGALSIHFRVCLSVCLSVCFSVRALLATVFELGI